MKSIGEQVREMMHHPLFKEHHPDKTKRQLEEQAIKYAKSRELRKRGRIEAAKRILKI